MATVETVRDYIGRMLLVTRSVGHVRLTRVAKLLLSEAETATPPREVLLAAGDEWAFRDVLRAVLQVGPCLLVDP
jgi:hypothetical protein